ncbi:5-hydroxytryptamine receptor 2A, partial [Pseudolycoriella hygida]
TTILLLTSNSNAFINGVEEQQNYTLIDRSLLDNELQPSSSNNLETKDLNNYWALLALVLVLGTAAGNILVCLAIAWERRLQNVTNYFLMSLAITDLMVAILVMPLGILTLVKGYFPLHSEHCLVWICLDVLFCTASIMHLCTISIDRYLSLRYPMRFGRNKTRKRVTIKIIFVWLLSIAMSLPLCLMYSKDHASVLVNGICQIPDPVYKLVGSIVCFYIPLGVMLITYCLTVRLLARQQQNLGGNQQQNSGWSSGWLGQAPAIERRCTWRKLLKTSLPSTPSHAHSATSTDTELSTLDNHELWLPDSSIPEPTPSTMTALHQFGAEMLRLSRGLESVSAFTSSPPKPNLHTIERKPTAVVLNSAPTSPCIRLKKRRASHTTWNADLDQSETPKGHHRKRFNSLPRVLTSIDNSNNGFPKEKEFKNKNNEKFKNLLNKKDTLDLVPPPCTCPYFGDTPQNNTLRPPDVKIITTSQIPPPPPIRKHSYSKSNSVVTWDTKRHQRRGSSFGGVRTSLQNTTLLLTPTKAPASSSPLRRSATLRNHNNIINNSDPNLNHIKSIKGAPSSPCLLQRSATIRSHHSRNSSVISRNSSRHGRIIRLEQKATKVLGVVFFTFVILWAPFFVLNLLPSLCRTCEENMSGWVFDVVTWLGYASSMVNPIFYTIFNKVFRQAFKKVLLCQYSKTKWRPQR